MVQMTLAAVTLNKAALKNHCLFLEVHVILLSTERGYSIQLPHFTTVIPTQIPAWLPPRGLILNNTLTEADLYSFK